MKSSEEMALSTGDYYLVIPSFAFFILSFNSVNALFLPTYVMLLPSWYETRLPDYGCHKSVLSFQIPMIPLTGWKLSKELLLEYTGEHSAQLVVDNHAINLFCVATRPYFRIIT